MKNMYFNLTQMLQGCSKRNGMTVSASMHDDGQNCNVKQRAELTSVEEKWSENGALSSTCLRSASDALSFRSRYLRYAAMIFAVLVMSVANIGMAWGTEFTFSGVYNGTGNGSWNTTTATTPIVTVSKSISNTSKQIYCVNAASVQYPSLSNKDSYIKFSVPNGYRITNVNVTWMSNINAQKIIALFGESLSAISSYVVTATNGGYVISNAIANSGSTNCNDGYNFAISSSHNAKEVMLVRGIAYDNSTYSTANTKYGTFPALLGNSSSGVYTHVEGSGSAAYIGKVVLTVEPTTTTKYTLSYDANGGTGTMPSHEFAAGTTVYAAQNAGFTAPSGKIFKCWNTKANGSGTSYSEWASFSLSANTTLYAQWITASTSKTYCISLYNLNVSNQMKYFTYSGYDDMQILDLEVPNYKTGNDNNFWVGAGGSWKSGNLGNSGASSANEKMKELCLKGNRGQKLGTGSQGVLARFFIYDNSTYNNLYIEFTPKQYSLIWGPDGSSWSPVKLYPSGYENEWTSEVVTLTSDQISSYKYYVGTLKADNGVAFWYKSKTLTVGSMGTYNKRTDTWGGNVNTLSAGAKGFFRMWQNATGYDNWRCHFVPVYTLSYNANGGEGAPASAYTATEGDAAARTLKVSMTEPTRNGYSFEGWATSSANASAGTVAYAPGASITLSADQELWAVWSCITPDAPTADKISVSDQCEGTGVTFTANTTGIPSYMTWYWQDAADGTSTSNPATSDFTTATTPGTYTKYLRAKNTVCGLWSASGSTPSKSAKVKTVATVSWDAHPTTATVGDGGKTFSVTTNYESGLVWTLESNTCDATLTGSGTSRTLNYTGAGSVVVKATVTGAGDYCSSAVVSETVTVLEAVDCSGDPTALVSGTLYKAQDMKSACFKAVAGDYVYGLSENGKFYITGTTNGDNSSTGTVQIKGKSAEIDEIGFDTCAYLKGEGSTTCRSIKFVTGGAGTLTIYGYTKKGNYGDLQIKPADGDAVTLITHSTSSEVNASASRSVTAGTYYILSNGGGAALYGLKFVDAPSTFTVSASVDPAGYGTLSASSITDVASGTAISASSNVLTVGASSITATPAATTAQYTYAFNNWTWTPAGETVTSDVTATANFTRTPVNYTLTWDVNGGVAGSCSGCTTGTVAYGTTLVAPGDPTRDGYDFAGWSPTPAATMPATNTTYTATWTLATYSITYDLHDGGAGSLDGEKTSYHITDEDYDLPTPEWTGHTFLGWYATYSAGVYSDPVSVLTSGSTGNKTYHAKWADGVEIVWTITKVDSKLYKGGTGYSVKAVVNNTSWTGHDNLVLSASDGVTLGTPTKSTVDSKAQIVADFSISGSLAEDAITFSLYAPATGVYAAIEDEKEVELDDCPGGSVTNITIFDGTISTNPVPNADDGTAGLTYKKGKQYTDGTTGFKYKLVGIKDGLADDISEATYTGKGDEVNAIQWGGSSTSYYGEYIVPKGYTASITVTYVLTANASKYIGFGSTKSATPNGSNYTSNATISSNNVVGTSTFSSISEGTYYFLCSGGDKFLILAMSATLTSSDGGVATSLAWSSSLADKATVDKRDIDADFQYYASPTPSNAGGPISYTSSDESVATVSSNGTVHIVGDGSTTITAAMPAYGCYSAATSITYSLVVANTCSDTPGTIVNNDGSAIAGNAVNRGACETLTLKLTGHSGSTIQWKKDGVNIPSANAATYSVPTGESGVYSATVEGSCTLSSTNSITVTTAGVPEPTIFADDFYVKSGKWFGYRLMQINRGETVTVKTAPTGWTEDTDFSITTDASGIVSISGRKTISTPANKTLTLTIANGCGGSVDKNITIREMADTAKPTIAWIATNNKGGSGQKDNVKADESTNTDLYDYLKDDYVITPRNCYWTTNEADLVKEYSQYDLIILTDYPNSGTCPSGKSGKSNSYTNAIGLLIDHKPIMTFEAFVAGCPNWGIASDPQNTQATQTDLTLLCNADEIFGTSGKFGAGQAITVTSASSGQALQGFPVASSPDFVFIGKITDRDEKTYVACCERQHKIAARMMVFGLNSSIMSSLTVDGKTMVEGFIEYLLKDDPASVPDCSVIFNGGGGDNSWYNTSNWEAGLLPDQYASVRIDAPCVVPENTNPAKAGGIKIHVGDAFNGSLTIEPEGRMIVEKTITRIEGNAYTIHMPTEPEDLIIQSDETAQGALIFDNESGTTQATVGMYSKGRYYDGVYNWQYVAVPLVSASRWNMGDWAYCFDNSIGGWTGNDVCPAFSAVGVTRMDDALPTYVFSGPLASTKNQTLTLYTSAAGNDGYNMIGNSWTAPIQIVNFQPGDFGTARYQVNIYNTGHDPEGGPAAEESKDQQGRWKTIPIASAQAAIDAGTWADLKVIPSMQAFEVQNATGANTTLTLNYDRLVRTLPTEPNLNETKRAPRRTPVERTAVPQMRITLKDETTRENLYLFSGEQFSEGFDNGWDGVYNAGEAGYMQIYMLSPIGNLEISAQPEMEGTTFGFTAGSREVYTFSFKYVGNEELYFNDLKEKKSTLINDENEYTFTAQEGENGIRFMISATPYNSQQITTGMTDLDAEASQAQKVIYNDKLYIIRGGKVFSADGHLVK